MRALVTGAGGFVGPHLVAHLTAAGDDVVGVDRESGVDVTDGEALGAVFAEHRPEAVYHLAALSHVAESWGDPADVVRVNVEGTARVLEAARRTGARRVLVVGSAEEYGRVRPEEIPVGEDAPLRPLTPYGATKVAAGFLALQAWLGPGLPTIRVRPFNHTGPGQGDRFLVPALARRIAQAEAEAADEVRVGALDPIRDLTDVRDVVGAYRALVLHGEPGEVYNVCSGRGVAVREVAERLVARARRPLRLRDDPGLRRPVEVPRLVGDPGRIASTTGWAPAIDLETTLDDVLAEARDSLAGEPSGTDV